MSQEVRQAELREKTQRLLHGALKHVRVAVLAAALVPLGTVAVSPAVAQVCPSAGCPTVDHFKCYEAKGNSPNVTVSLADQFGAEPKVLVGEPVLFCNPVDKNGEGINDPTTHLTCYKIGDQEQDEQEWDVSIENQLDAQTLTVGEPQLLCVPSATTAVVPHQPGDDHDKGDKHHDQRDHDTKHHERD